MTTIVSPRPSVSLSSRRGSGSSNTTITSASARQTAGTDRASLRRNRVALRDYYGLKQADPVEYRETSPPPVLDAVDESELDKPGFEPEAYVEHLLTTEGTEGVLRVEAGLVSVIRSLDGEKKALVYDNYSKLIAATDTIRNMREKMDPMSPTTNTLTPAIGHIAETAAKLAEILKKSRVSPNETGNSQEHGSKVSRQVGTVKWALAAPSRIHAQKLAGDEEAANGEWSKISNLLDTWQDVKGVAQLRQACLEELDRGTSP